MLPVPQENVKTGECGRQPFGCIKIKTLKEELVYYLFFSLNPGSLRWVPWIGKVSLKKKIGTSSWRCILFQCQETSGAAPLVWSPGSQNQWVSLGKSSGTGWILRFFCWEILGFWSFLSADVAIKKCQGVGVLWSRGCQVELTLDQPIRALKMGYFYRLRSIIGSSFSYWTNPIHNMWAHTFTQFFWQTQFYIYIYILIYMYMYTYLHTHILYICIYIYVYVYILTHTYYIYVYIYIYYIHIFVYIYTYIYIHTFVYTYTHI